MKYSIILPVRNGGEYVKECVNSILAQTLNDFNLHVLDNNSTDGTLEWINSLNDKRIKIHPSGKSLTIEENWSRALNIPKNEFSTLIGHDDVLENNYLKIMDELITKYPDSSLYQTHFTYINSVGGKLRECKAMPEVEYVSEFLSAFLANQVDIMGTGFMMRSADYESLGGIPTYPNLLFADLELWINLTRISYKATSLKKGFSFRLHESMTATSPDVKLQHAFERFIYFLKFISEEDPALNKAIKENGEQFIRANCKALSHRLLRTPILKRNNLSVKVFIKKCKLYADLLIPQNTFKPTTITSIWLAKVLDSSSIGRSLFLAFKRIYSHPIMK